MYTLQELLNKIKELDAGNEHGAVLNLLTDEVLQAHNDFRLFVVKAQLYNENKDGNNAYKYAQEAIKLAPENLNGYLQRGTAFFNANDFQNALADFKTVLKADNENFEVVFLTGQCWFYLIDYKNAIDAYSATIELANDEYKILAYYNRGLAKNALKKYESAIDDFNNVIQLNNNHYQAYCDKGVAHLMLQNYDEALQDFKNSLAIKQTYPIAFYNRGLLYHQQKKYTEAKEDYTRAIENASIPADKFIISNAYNNRGNINMVKEAYEEALIDFNKALDLNPSMGEAYLNRGIIFQQQLQYVKALSDFRKAIELFQPNSDGYEIYINFLEEQAKAVDEKITEADTLSRLEAKEDDKKAFVDTGKKLDELIDFVSKAARSQVKAVVHYTKLFVADIYVKAATSKMNYSNAIYMNDPNEGKVLLNYMDNADIKNAFESGEKLSELSVYFGSFLPAEDGDLEPGHNDELVMWRTYGRDGDGNEACGCSIIIDSRFFKPPVSMDKPVTGENADVLCKVIYIKDMGKAEKLLCDKETGIEDAIGEFKNQLLNLIKLKDTYDSQHAFTVMIDKLIYKKYSKIAYLFKSADFEYEHEVRVIKYVPRNSDTIKCYPIENKGKPGRLYVESVNPVFPFIQKIYLGPKVQDSIHWSLYLDYKIKHMQNEYKLNKMPEYKLNSGGIKIVKSEKKFV